MALGKFLRVALNVADAFLVSADTDNRQSNLWDAPDTTVHNQDSGDSKKIEQQMDLDYAKKIGLM